MDFKDKYTSATDKEKDKRIIPDDIYALCEVIDNLIKSIEHTRVTLMQR